VPGIIFDRAEKLVAHEAEYGTDPFSTQAKKIIGRFIEAGRLDGEMPDIKTGSKFSGQFFEAVHSLSDGLFFSLMRGLGGGVSVAPRSGPAGA
jgi:hypothetical protein